MTAEEPGYAKGGYGFILDSYKEFQVEVNPEGEFIGVSKIVDQSGYAVARAKTLDDLKRELDRIDSSRFGQAVIGRNPVPGNHTYSKGKIIGVSYIQLYKNSSPEIRYAVQYEDGTKDMLANPEYFFKDNEKNWKLASEYNELEKQVRVLTEQENKIFGKFDRYTNKELVGEFKQ